MVVGNTGLWTHLHNALACFLWKPQAHKRLDHYSQRARGHPPSSAAASAQNWWASGSVVHFSRGLGRRFTAAHTQRTGHRQSLKPLRKEVCEQPSGLWFLPNCLVMSSELVCPSVSSLSEINSSSMIRQAATESCHYVFLCINNTDTDLHARNKLQHETSLRWLHWLNINENLVTALNWCVLYYSKSVSYSHLLIGQHSGTTDEV